MKKKIFITSTSNLITDQRVAKMVEYLLTKELDVTVLARKFPREKRSVKSTEYNSRILKMIFKKGLFFYAEFNLKIFFYLLFKKADYYMAIDLDTLLACKTASLFKRVPIIFDSHEYFPEVPEVVNRPLVKKIWTIIENLIVPSVWAAITVSEGVAGIYKKIYGKEFILVRNIPSANNDSVHEVRDVSESPIVYYQGALNIGRGLEESIKAMKYLPNYIFNIVGGGDIENELKELTKKLNLEDRVNFIGVIPYNELENYASKADIGLCLLRNLGLNYYHSLPNRLFDYPKMGLPILATAFPDIKSFIDEYKTGVYINGLNPKLIAEKIKYICENRDIRKEMSVNLRKVATELSWEREIEKIDFLFDDR